jgi:hypothetical protein
MTLKDKYNWLINRSERNYNCVYPITNVINVESKRGELLTCDANKIHTLIDRIENERDLTNKQIILAVNLLYKILKTSDLDGSQ